MLLKDFVEILYACNPQIFNTVTVEDIVIFCTVSSDLVVRAERGLSLTSTDRPLRYLLNSLPESLHDKIDMLWRTSFGFLRWCYIIPQEMVTRNGVLPGLPDGRLSIRVPHHFLFPPDRFIIDGTCPNCQDNKKMTIKSLFGYLYDVSECRTIQHFQYYCKSTSTHLIMNNLTSALCVSSILISVFLLN